MVEIIDKKIETLERKLEDLNGMLDYQVAELRENVNHYDADSIVDFVPQRIVAIGNTLKEIKIINEQIRMLVWMKKEVEDSAEG